MIERRSAPGSAWAIAARSRTNSSASRYLSRLRPARPAGMSLGANKRPESSWPRSLERIHWRASFTPGERFGPKDAWRPARGGPIPAFCSPPATTALARSRWRPGRSDGGVGGAALDAGDAVSMGQGPPTPGPPRAWIPSGHLSAVGRRPPATAAGRETFTSYLFAASAPILGTSGGGTGANGFSPARRPHTVAKTVAQGQWRVRPPVARHARARGGSHADDGSRIADPARKDP